MIWHSSEKESVLQFFGVDKNNGLSVNKTEIILNDLKNNNQENHFISLIRKFGKQFNKVLTIILLISVALSITISAITNAETEITTLIIVAIMVLYGVFSIIEKRIYEKSYHSLDDYKRTYATVIRDGNEMKVSADCVVPGDIIKLNFGDLIPADARLIETLNFRCDEYVLTGETVYVEKDCDVLANDISDIKERKNMVFAGCSVMSGQATAVVTDIANETELAKQKINNSYLYDDKKSEIAQVAQVAAVAVGVVASLVFILHLIFSGNSHEENFALTVIHAVIGSVALAIACYPESLPNLISVIKSIGTRKLLSDGTVVLKPHAVKKASKISVICADKGEVFTTDKFSVAKLYDGKKITDLSETAADDANIMLLKLSALCFDESNPDPTDLTIAEFCEHNLGLNREDTKNLYPMLSLIPFDNDRKLVTTVNMVNGKPFAIVKGAPEELIHKCIGIDSNAALKVNEMLAEDALKVIAVAYKELTEVPALPNTFELESDLTFSGYIGFETHLSENIVETVKILENASIRTVMITGDNLTTAKAIARRVGILHDNLKYITNDELTAMTDEELDKEVTSYALFARITPENRFRIVKALQHNNEKVAITGSTVFDAPSLRKASVGLALKNSATDVARDASDLIINNTGLSSILKMIATCKSIYGNVKRAVHYMISSNLGELLTEFIGLIIFKVPVFLAAQLLLVNLITDIFPTISVAMSPIDTTNITKEKSRIFTMQSVVKMLIQGSLIAIFSLIGFSIGNTHTQAVGKTIVFAVIGFSQIVHIICCQSDDYIFRSKIPQNKFVIIASVISILVMILILATPAGALFGLVIIPKELISTVIILPLLFLICDELIKLGFSLYNKFSK